MAVYGDWLEERADPRGTLMRMDSQSTEGGLIDDFILRHWARWFSDVLPRPTRSTGNGLTWKAGFVRAAWFHFPAGADLSRLWALPVMRFLDEVSITRAIWRERLAHLRGVGPSPFEGLQQLPCLRVLEASRLGNGDLALLAGQRLGALESLTLDFPAEPSEDDLHALETVELPALRAVKWDLSLVAAKVAKRLAPIISRWAPSSIWIDLEDKEVLTELIPLFESPHTGEVTLSMPPDLASAWRNRLRALNPKVQLRLRLPYEYEWETMLTSATSWFVPVPRDDEEDHEAWSTTTWSDEGRPLLEIDPDGFQVCGACAGTKVLCHYRRERTPLREHECTGEIDVEMRCDECGQFSRYKRRWHAGYPVIDDLSEWYWDHVGEETAAIYEEQQRELAAAGASAEVKPGYPAEEDDASF